MTLIWVGRSQPFPIFCLRLDALETIIRRQRIKFEMPDAERNEAKIHFFEKTDFPGVIGCVDGTHITILAPNKEVHDMYFNRKGFYSLNAMIVCMPIM